MNVNNEHICYLPWVGLDISQQGEFRPCCKYDETSKPLPTSLEEYQSSQELADLKASFLAGEKPPGCRRCWNDEASGLPSKRQIDFAHALNNQIPTLGSIRILGFTFGNSCNLSCRMCDSYASSSWISDEKKLKINFPDLKIYKHQRFYQDAQFMKSILKLSSDVVQIDFAGGETFITGLDEHLEFLDFFVRNKLSNKVSLRYITNGTVFPKNEFWKIWENFKSIEIQISIDGTENQYSYIRHLAKWSDVLNNITLYKQKPNIKMCISHTISILNVFYIPEFTIWCLQNGFGRPYYGLVETPKHYNIQSLPLKIKNRISEKLNRFNFKNVVNYMYESDTSDNFETFIKLTNELDRIRNQSFGKVFPEFHQLLKDEGCQI